MEEDGNRLIFSGFHTIFRPVSDHPEAIVSLDPWVSRAFGNTIGYWKHNFRRGVFTRVCVETISLSY